MYANFSFFFGFILEFFIYFLLRIIKWFFLLFNIVLDSILREAIPTNTHIIWGLYGMLDDLDYADDICRFAQKNYHMISKLQSLCNMAAKCGLKINVGKTKTMNINISTNKLLTINDAEIESVSSFTYCGRSIYSSGGSRDGCLRSLRCGHSHPYPQTLK